MELTLDFVGATYLQDEFQVNAYKTPTNFYNFFIFERDELRSAIFNLM